MTLDPGDLRLAIDALRGPRSSASERQAADRIEAFLEQEK